MAIIKLTTGTPTRGSANGQRINPGSTGQTTMQASTSNRKPTAAAQRNGIAQPTPKFHGLDNQILALDAAYDLLTNKAPWVTYAANIAGEWQLCANCQPDSAAKKLYRQYNFNRSLIGLPQVATPVDNTEFYDAFINPVVFTQGLPLQPDFIVVRQFTPVSDFLIIAQNGGGLGNPSAFIPLAAQGLVITAGPIFNAVTAIFFACCTPPTPGHTAISYVPCCVASGTGAPGLTIEQEFDWYIN